MTQIISLLKKIKKIGKKYLYNVYYRTRLVDTLFPPEVWMENTNCCDAKCVMCPRDRHTRKQGFMEITLFEKIIKEIGKHRDFVKKIHLHNYGEPLLDKDLPVRIQMAKEYGIKHVYFVTNASLLTQEKSEELIKSGLDEFKISFCGTDEESYNKTMVGLNFHTTLRNIKDFFTVRKKLNTIKPRIIIQYLPQDTNKGKIEEFITLFKDMIDEAVGDRINIFTLHDFAGGREYKKLGEIIGICHYPWQCIVILYDGSVVTCCLDYNGVQIIGDVNKSSIEEIWTGSEFQGIRSDFKKLNYSKYPCCIKCDIIR